VWIRGVGVSPRVGVGRPCIRSRACSVLFVPINDLTTADAGAAAADGRQERAAADDPGRILCDGAGVLVQPSRIASSYDRPLALSDDDTSQRDPPVQLTVVFRVTCPTYQRLCWESSAFSVTEESAGVGPAALRRSRVRRAISASTPKTRSLSPSSQRYQAGRSAGNCPQAARDPPRSLDLPGGPSQ
jgi:hypothetical protein